MEIWCATDNCLTSLPPFQSKSISPHLVQFLSRPSMLYSLLDFVCHMHAKVFLKGEKFFGACGFRHKWHAICMCRFGYICNIWVTRLQMMHFICKLMLQNAPNWIPVQIGQPRIIFQCVQKGVLLEHLKVNQLHHHLQYAVWRMQDHCMMR